MKQTDKNVQKVADLFIRFPDYISLVDAGFLLPHEAVRLAGLDNQVTFLLR
jgi:hypothetical protein